MLKPLAQTQEGVQLAVLLVSDRVVHIHGLVEEGKDRALRSGDGGLEDIAVAGALGGGFAVGLEALAALLLDGAVQEDHIPAILQTGLLQESALKQAGDHAHGQGSHLGGIDPAGMIGGVVRAGDGGVSIEAPIFGSLAAEGSHVPSPLAGLAVLVELVAGAATEQEGGDGVPPEVGPGVATHLLAAGVGKGVEPVVELGEDPVQDLDQGLGGLGGIQAWQGRAADRFAVGGGGRAGGKGFQRQAHINTLIYLLTTAKKERRHSVASGRGAPGFRRPKPCP